MERWEQTARAWGGFTVQSAVGAAKSAVWVVVMLATAAVSVVIVAVALPMAAASAARRACRVDRRDGEKGA